MRTTLNGPCKCSGNHSIHHGISGFKCECGGEIKQDQVMVRLLRRIVELEDSQFHLIEGLVAADMGECGVCGNWFKDAELLRAGDRACCDRCWNWEYFIRENDDSETMDQILPHLMNAICGGRFNKYYGKPFLDLLPKDKDGLLEEPFLTEYRKRSK